MCTSRGKWGGWIARNGRRLGITKPHLEYKNIVNRFDQELTSLLKQTTRDCEVDLRHSHCVEGTEIDFHEES